MMKTQLTLILLLIFSFKSSIAQESKPLKVGEELLKVFENAHPYNGVNSNTYEVVSTQRIFEKDASYIAVHFDKFQLAPDDYLIIRNPENTRSWKYSIGKESRKQFWSVHIYGEEAIIEIVSKSKEGAYGYRIDKIAKGFQDTSITYNYEPEALCGPDDSEEGVCYQNTEPFAYDRSRAVARLLINGTSACTGWLIGDDGHLMTNEHCVGSAATANNVTVEFMAEGGNCATDCRNWFDCAGTIEATTTNLVRVNANLDYALLELPTNVSNQYGFLQLREAGAIQGEQIYIPQHPQAWGKRIALNSTDQNDTGGVARIFSLDEPRCGGSGNDIGYYADTQGGSSGSPVLGYDDNLVVALHHCGACPNRGVPIQEIINDLGNDLPVSAIAGVIRGPESFCKYTQHTYTVSSLPSNVNDIIWDIPQFMYIHSGQGTNTVTLGYYGGDHNGEHSISVDITTSDGDTYQVANKVVTVYPYNNQQAITPTIQLHPQNPQYLYCCGIQYFYQSKCSLNCNNIEWEFNVFYQDPQDTFEFDTNTGLITGLKQGYGPLILETKARNKPENCGQYSEYSNSNTRYYGVLSANQYNTAEIQKAEDNLPIFVNFSKTGGLKIKKLDLLEWMNAKYSGKLLSNEKAIYLSSLLNNYDNNGDIKIEFYDFYGQQLFKESFNNDEVNYNIELPNKIVILRVSIDKFYITKKLIL